MRRRAPRVALALAAALVGVGPVAAVAARSPSSVRAAAGACQDDTGITVVVDASAFGDGVQVRCAPQPVRSGFEALTKAGFTWQGTTQHPGLLCRIDGEPAADPCHAAPPPNAYWAYWHAPRGGDWTYSTSGAGSRVPPRGSVEGWAFGDDAEPGIAPPAPAPTTSTTVSSTVTTRPSGGGGGSATPSAAGASTTTPPGEVPDETSTTAAQEETTTTALDVVERDIDDGSDEQAAALPTSAGSDGGSPVGAIVGLVAVTGLAAGAIAVAKRRRSAEAETA